MLCNQNIAVKRNYWFCRRPVSTPGAPAVVACSATPGPIYLIVMAQITIVGLGPGPRLLLTREAQDVLSKSSDILLRTIHHPVAEWLARKHHVTTYDDALLHSFSDAAGRDVVVDVANDVLNRAVESVRVVYGVPGHPLEGDETVRQIIQLAPSRSVTIRIITGVSFFDAVIEAIPTASLAVGLQVVDAIQVDQVMAARSAGAIDPFLGVYRVFDPAAPVVMCQIYTTQLLKSIGALLQSVYGPTHHVSIVGMAKSGNPGRKGASSSDTADTSELSAIQATVPVAEVAQWKLGGRPVCLYVPPLGRLDDLASFNTLRYIVARLRAPGGCPWDREQTYQSMKKHLIEETYEAVAALDEEDYGRFAEELGDVLLQVVMHCQLGREAGDFTLEDVLNSINSKLVRRHPHVFGNVEVKSSSDVLRNWEAIKRTEGKGTVSSFAGVPEAAPALVRADAIQSRATRYGWVPPTSVIDITPLFDDALSADEFRRRLGEALFDEIALARKHHVDAEEALRLATTRFAKSLDAVLARCHAEGIDFETLSPERKRELLAEASPSPSPD